MKKQILLLTLLLLFRVHSYTQQVFTLSFSVQRQIDSLNQIITENKHDTSIASAYISLSNILHTYNLDTVVFLCEKARTIANDNLTIPSLGKEEKKSFNRSLATSYNNIGYVHENKGNLNIGIEHYQKALNIQKEIKNARGVATSLNNMGYAHYLKGDIKKALDFLHKALHINEELGNSQGKADNINNIALVYQNKGDLYRALEYYMKSLSIDKTSGNESNIAITFNNIGYIYQILDEDSKALEHYHEALIIQKKLNNKQEIGNILNNIGSIYENNGDILAALDYHDKSLAIRKEIKDKKGIAISFNHIGKGYYLQNHMTQALEYYSKALKIHEEIDYKHGITISLINLGELYHTLNNILLASDYSKKALKLAKELGFPELIKRSAYVLSNIYEEQNNWEEESKFYKLYIQVHDSLENIKLAKKIARIELQQQYEKEQALITANHKKQVKVQQVYTISLGLLSLLILSMGVIAYKSQKRKQQLTQSLLEIEKLNSEIDKQNFEKQIDAKSKELIGSNLKLTQNEQFLSKLNTLIAETQHSKSTTEINKYVQNLKKELKINEYQKNNQSKFQKQFEIMNQDFIKNLKTKHPKLSSTELRTCALIKMNMSTNDICSLLDIPIRTLATRRYRIHKKMKLPKGSKLSDYLIQL